MKLKAKYKPRGRPFQKGVCQHRNGSGKPFIKWQQKLSVIAAEDLALAADDELCAQVGLPRGSTNGMCVVRAQILKAVEQRDTGAAQFLFQCTEAAKVRIEAHVDVDLAIYERALQKLDEIMTVPALPEGEPE